SSPGSLFAEGGQQGRRRSMRLLDSNLTIGTRPGQEKTGANARALGRKLQRACGAGPRPAASPLMATHVSHCGISAGMIAGAAGESARATYAKGTIDVAMLVELV